MIVYITLDENGYVDGWGSTPSHVDNEIEIDLDENHDFLKRILLAGNMKMEN